MVPILANIPILGRFLRVGCSRSFREKTTFVAQNKKNMVNVIVLCIELLLDIVGLVLGILVYSRSSDNNGLTKHGEYWLSLCPFFFCVIIWNGCGFSVEEVRRRFRVLLKFR